MLMVDRAGIEPASRTHFASLHTAIMLFKLIEYKCHRFDQNQHGKDSSQNISSLMLHFKTVLILEWLPDDRCFVV